ncbi:MAG: hypothetical protein ABW318_09680 [Vicinamibacterales bacterium]
MSRALVEAVVREVPRRQPIAADDPARDVERVFYPLAGARRG